MTNFHFITYATHSEGTFQELINNEYNIPIKVLGWGTEWKGFMDKFKSMYSYIKTLPDDDVVFFIDGFDSVINQPLEKIKEIFSEFNSDIILSLDHTNDNIPFGLKYLGIKSFGTCKNDLVANSGLYCGYNKDIQKLLKYVLNKNYSSDDQRNLNEACQYFNNIYIDSEKKLFDNLNHYNRYFDKTDSCFVSTPGKLSFNRIKRIPGEYLPFIWKECILIILLICIIIYLYKRNKVKILNMLK